jgi:uncharacterized protein (DUF983 family)
MNFKFFKKGTKKYSVLKLKCPKCHEGNLFVYKNPYRIKGGLKMDDNCLVCGQDFVIEPGFYYGALWMSYPVVILITIALALFFYFYLDYTLLVFMLILSVVMLGLQPLIIRLGRALWINVFVRYEKVNEK